MTVLSRTSGVNGLSLVILLISLERFHRHLSRLPRIFEIMSADRLAGQSLTSDIPFVN
jgi:hypothetical protein